MIHRKPASLALLALSAVALTSCASLGGNVKGDFLCRAPGGSCAPSIVIDDQALAQIGEARPLPASQSSPWNLPKRTAPQVAQAVNGVVNAPPRVTQVVFPAFVDSNGYLHEARKVKMVTQAGGWVQLADAAPNPVSGALAAAHGRRPRTAIHSRHADPASVVRAPRTRQKPGWTQPWQPAPN